LISRPVARVGMVLSEVEANHSILLFTISSECRRSFVHVLTELLPLELICQCSLPRCK